MEEGVTGGVHPSVAAGQRARLGRAGPESQGDCGIGGRAYWAAGAGGPKRGKEGGNLKERVSIFSKHNQTLNSNEFEFKHPKMMHRHVCYSKLLYFIN
jgi:hypothetical protein